MTIPATRAARPQLDVLGAYHMLGMGVGVASGTDAGAGVGVTAATLIVMVAALPAAEPSVA